MQCNGGRRGGSGVVAAVILGLVLALFAGPASAAEQNIDHGGVVPDIPRRDLPVIQGGRSGEVLGGDQVGRYLVVGGEFTTMQRPDGSTVTQPRLAAFDIETGALVESFRPQVDGDVHVVFPGPDDTSVYIGGDFSTVNGQPRNRLARVNLADGSLDTDFRADTSGRVTTIDEAGGRLFIGGDFTFIKGQRIEYLAELNPETGAVNTAFSFDFETSFPAIHAAEIVADGDRLAVVHQALSINGTPARHTAVFDISNPANPILTPHTMSSRPGISRTRITGGDVSPDGQWIAVSQGFATFADYVYLVAVSDQVDESGGWSHYMADSNTNVTVSDAAVYVGGHFCKPEGGPGPTDPGEFKGLDCTSSRGNFPGTVWRKQLAALSIADGTPFAWDPGNDAFRGAELVHATANGLMVGYDGNRTAGYPVGTFAFFDVGGPLPPPPPPPPPPPGDQTCDATVDGGTVTLTWDAIDGEDTYQVRRDNAFVATVGGGGLTYDDTPVAGDHSYVIRSRMGGVTTDTPCDPNPVTVEEDEPQVGQTCDATVDDGTVTLTWDAIDGENTYHVRRDNTFVATVGGGGLTYDDTPVAGDHSYVIRSRMGGVTTDTVCDPDPVGV